VVVTGTYTVSLATNISAVNSITLTDYVLANRHVNQQGTLAYSSTPALDFSAVDDLTITLTGAATFSTANLAAGVNKTLRVIGQAGSASALAFPGGWTWLNGSMPTSLAATKTGILTLKSFGTADANVIAAWAASV
jgi:hypothetical protein